MTDLLTQESSEQIVGGLMLLCTLILLWKIGIRSILSDLVGQLLAPVVIVLALVAMAVFFATDLGQRLGGIDSLKALVFTLSAVLVAIGLWRIFRNVTSRGDNQSPPDDPA
ncbi:MAG: hypothetical protein AAF415_06070 [Pseudomonadota bacterium]